jgi:hypothetical protein
MINEFKPIVSPYFGENGLTSTSANTIANRLKHLYESTENELNAVNFVQTKFGLIGTPEEQFSLAEDANKSCTAIEFVTKLELITECKSFIAFLREAIKAKQELSNEVDEYMSEELVKLKKPILERPITVEDVINNMSVKDREHYLFLETRAAVYGKFIHPGNPFDKAIKGIEKAIATPREISYNGSNTIIKVHTPTVSIEQTSSVYMGLQNEHRKAESELNGIKHMIEETIKADDVRKREAYKADLAKYEAEYEALALRDAETMQARRKEIEALKIVIPKRFEALYNKIK